MRTLNEFKLGGRYKHFFKIDDTHFQILVEVFKDEKNTVFIEVDIFDKELISLIDNLKENELVFIFGHVDREIIQVNAELNFMDKLLIADKIIRKGN